MADTNLARSLPPGVDVTQLTDAELLAGTRRLVGRTNLILAELLAHLGEVEARGLHRTRACSSLYIDCVYELRFSEDEACRRVAAARLVKRFPVLLDAIVLGGAPPDRSPHARPSPHRVEPHRGAASGQASNQA